MRVIKTGECFRLIKAKGRYWIKLRAHLTNCTPKAKRVSERNVRYLLECGNSFDAACVMDFGVGVFQRGHSKPITYP